MLLPTWPDVGFRRRTMVGCWLGPHGTVQGKHCGVDWFESKERKSTFKLLSNNKFGAKFFWGGSASSVQFSLERMRVPVARDIKRILCQRIASCKRQYTVGVRSDATKLQPQNQGFEVDFVQISKPTIFLKLLFLYPPPCLGISPVVRSCSQPPPRSGKMGSCREISGRPFLSAAHLLHFNSFLRGSSSCETACNEKKPCSQLRSSGLFFEVCGTFLPTSNFFAKVETSPSLTHGFLYARC